MVDTSAECSDEGDQEVARQLELCKHYGEPCGRSLLSLGFMVGRVVAGIVFWGRAKPRWSSTTETSHGVTDWG